MTMNNEPAQDRSPAVALVQPERGNDALLVQRLTDLINDVYATAEKGLWREGATRTTTSEIAELIKAREIYVAIRNGAIVGAMRLHGVSQDTSEFGLLASHPDHRGVSVGRALLDFAEQDSRERGLQAIQLELLVPRSWSHPSKEFLKGWYGRRGYRLVRRRKMDDAYPHVAPLLATPCDLEIHAKPLQP
jgi:ribosomal protein S18 acetylase RimI-like enzyme